MIPLDNIVVKLKNEKKQSLITSKKAIKKDKEITDINSERFWDLLFLMSDWVWEVNSEGKYVFASGKVKDILGYESDELIGKTPFDFMPQDEAMRISEIFSRIISEKKPIVNLENWNLTKDKQKVCLLTNGIPLIDENGDFKGYRGLDRDITKKKNEEKMVSHADKILENRNELFRILYDTAIEVEGADSKKIFQILCRNLRRICKANLAALASYNSKTNKIKLESINYENDKSDNYKNITYHLNKEIINDFKHRQISKCQDHHNCLIEFFPELISSNSFLKDNEENCYRLSCIREGKLIALGLVQLPAGTKLKMKDIVDTYLNLAGMVIERIYDVRALGESEKLYRNLSRDLEQKVKERTLEVEKLLKLKDEFIYQLSHDLKNPLQPLVNLLPIIEKKIDNPECKEMIDILKRNTYYMKNLVIKTIQLAQLNSPKSHLSLETINLKNEINELILNNKNLLKDNKLIIENNVDDTLMIKGDKLKLNELFSNIFSNSIKYSLDICKISIFCEIDHDFVKIKITDNGIGMNGEQIEHIFDEFYKADPSRHDFESSGLGMTISKSIVEKHGGQIWVESDGLGKGISVFLTLPKA